MTVNFNLDNLRVDNQGRVRLGGASSGIDAVGAVDNIIRARRLPVDRIRTGITASRRELSALNELRTLTRGVQSSLTGLRAASAAATSDVFRSRRTYLSNYRTDGRPAANPADLLTVNPSANAALGENEIEIRQVARTHKIAGKNFASRTQALGLSGSLHLSGVHPSVSAPITIEAGDSLDTIRDRINAANRGANATGIAASVIEVSATRNTLVLTAQETARNIVVAGEAALIGDGLGLVSSDPVSGRLSGPAQAVIGPDAGIERIDFSALQAEESFQLTYDAPATLLTLTRVRDGVTQSVDIGNAVPVAGGALVPIDFGDFGAQIVLNSRFDAARSITAPASSFSSGNENSGRIDDDSIRLLRAQGDVSGFDFDRLSFDLGGPDFDATNITLRSGSFSGTFDGSQAGPVVVALTDGNGNNIVVSFELTAAFNDAGPPVINLGNHRFGADGNSGGIDPATIAVTTITGAVAELNHTQLDFDVADPAAILVSAFGFTGRFDGTTTGAKSLTLARDDNGDGIADATLGLRFNVEAAFDDSGTPTIFLNDNSYAAEENGVAIATDATLRLLGTRGDVSAIETSDVTFDAANPGRTIARLGDFSGSFDGARPGLKIVTLTDGKGNELTFQLSLTTAFGGGEDSASLSLGFLGNLVGGGGNLFLNQVQPPQNARLAIKGLKDAGRYESDIVPDKTAGLKGHLDVTQDSGSVSITVGGETATVNYNLADANDDGTSGDHLTLVGLADKINRAIDDAGNVNAKARIIDYTDGARLVIAATNPDDTVALGDPNFLFFNLGVDNVRVIERPDNTISDLFPGLTLTLLNAQEGTTLRLQTERDLNQIKQSITDFVTAYNAFKTFANTQNRTNPDTGQSAGEPLFGHQALRQIETELGTLVGTGVSNQGADLPIRVLAQVGIHFVTDADATSDQHDTLRIDEVALNDALLRDFDGVRRLFAFDSSISDSRVSFIGLEGVPTHNSDGYRLDLSYDGGRLDKASIREIGSATSYPVSITGNILQVDEGPAQGLRLFYRGGDDGPDSVTINFTTGFAQQAYDALKTELDPRNGSVVNAIGGIEESNTLAEAQIRARNVRIDLERERLLKRFERMEESLARANALRETLNQLFLALEPRRQ